MVKLDKKLGLGNLSCKVCGQRFQTGINCKPIIVIIVIMFVAAITDNLVSDLSAAVDVYSDWVDACDAVAKDTATKYEEGNPRSLRPLEPSSGDGNPGGEAPERSDPYIGEY